MTTTTSELLADMSAKLREWANEEREDDPAAADYGQTMADLFHARLCGQELGEIVDRLAESIRQHVFAEEEPTNA